MKFSVMTGIVALLVTNSAMADWYASGNFGYTQLGDQTSTGPSRRVEADFDSDVNFGGALGYSFTPQDLGRFRTEVEFQARENEVDGLNFNGNATNPNGDMSSYSVLFNGYYDFTSLHDKFIPYIGAGIGFTRVDADIQYGAASFNGDDTVLAFQGIFGVSYQASDNLSLFTDFRYHVADDPELNRFGGPAPAANVELESEYDTYGINFGVRYDF